MFYKQSLRIKRLFLYTNIESITGITSCRMRVRPVCFHEKLNLSLHLRVVDSLTFSKGETIPLLVRFFSIPLSTNILNYILFTEYSTNIQCTLHVNNAWVYIYIFGVEYLTDVRQLQQA